MNDQEKAAFRASIEEKFKYSREIEAAMAEDHLYDKAAAQLGLRSAYNTLLEELGIEPINLYPEKKDKAGLKIIAQTAGVNYVLMEDLVKHLAEEHNQKGWEASIYGKGGAFVEAMHQRYHDDIDEWDPEAWGNKHTHDRKIKVAGWKPKPGAH